MLSLLVFIQNVSSSITYSPTDASHKYKKDALQNSEDSLEKFN